MLYNSITLVPVELFDELNVTREYVDDFYMTRLIKDDNV